MGINSSCISSGVSVSIENVLKKKIKGTKTAMLLDTDGNTREIKLPAISGELMIEEFGHVITPVEQLKRTGRVSALLADEQLVAGKAYLLLPVNRVHSKASKSEMAIAEKVKHGGNKTKGMKGNNNYNNINNMAKVSPSHVSRSSERDIENEVNNVFPLCPPRTRLGNQARWNPVLDPIFEYPSSQFCSEGGSDHGDSHFWRLKHHGTKVQRGIKGIFSAAHMQELKHSIRMRGV